ncbi:MAG TPA: hypothetical protein VN963_05230, partial [bacterium]|nr:hypothetical protein [bacterium]
LRLPFHTLAEHEADRLTGEKTILFPSVKRLEGKALDNWIRAAQGRKLFVSGPIAQDGWGQPTEGLSAFGVREKRVEVQPEEILKLKKGIQSLSYGSHKTNWVDKDLSLFPELHHFSRNKTSLHYIPVPVEANDQRRVVESFYREMAVLAGIKPYCEMSGASDWEVTVLPRVFSKTVLYIAVNEGSFDRLIRIKDTKFGFKAALSVPAGRAALVVFDAKGKVLVRYHSPDF